MALECKNLGFFYEKHTWIFRNIDITVEKGSAFGIAGRSGCGKTSLSKVLANHAQPSEGEVRIDGINAKQIRAGGKRLFWPVQLIYQHPEPSPELLERFGVKTEWFKRFPIELSGGELQRCLIVRALHPEVRYLIADEMTTMLDAVTQALIWKELLAVIKQRNIGLIIISHEQALIEKLCSDALYMT